MKATVTEPSPSRWAAIAAPTACRPCAPIWRQMGAQHFSVNDSPPCQVPATPHPSGPGRCRAIRNAPSSRYCGNSQSVLRRQATAPILRGLLAAAGGEQRQFALALEVDELGVEFAVTTICS